MRRVAGAEVRFAAGVPNVGPFGDPQRIHDAVAIGVRCPQAGLVIRHGSHVSKANCPQ